MQKGVRTTEMRVFVCPQALQSECTDREPEAELWGTGFHRCHHQHPHPTCQHAWREPPPIACSCPRHPPQHTGHRLHPGQCQNFFLITSGQDVLLDRHPTVTSSRPFLLTSKVLPAEIDPTNTLSAAGYYFFLWSIFGILNYVKWN